MKTLLVPSIANIFQKFFLIDNIFLLQSHQVGENTNDSKQICIMPTNYLNYQHFFFLQVKHKGNFWAFVSHSQLLSKAIQVLMFLIEKPMNLEELILFMIPFNKIIHTYI